MKRTSPKGIYKILTGGLVLLGLLFYTGTPAGDPGAFVQSGGLIRLHVLANSDSEADQALKRKVRDEIVRDMAPKFLASGDIDSARSTARANLGRIESIASRVIREEGKDYPVCAELDTFSFPTKHYGAFVLPAGDYEAVRVVIGSGGGTNWWCVLFPPLCFVDMTMNATACTTAPVLLPNPPAPEDGADGQAVRCPDEPADGWTWDRAAGENGEDKVIFSFRLVELFKRL